MKVWGQGRLRGLQLLAEVENLSCKTLRIVWELSKKYTIMLFGVIGFLLTPDTSFTNKGH